MLNIYTIGHSNYPLDKLIHMLKYFKIDTVVDIRGTPYSKYNVQYNKEAFEKSLKTSGFNYIYMAREFAAKRFQKSSYNKEGYCDFEKAILEESFKTGIQRLINGCEKGYNIVLLGAMQDPIRCHRSILVGRELKKHGFKVNHILDDYSLASQSDIEEKLLDKYYKDRTQMTIEHLLGTQMTNEEMINESYRKANKEIGYRVENLK